MYQVTVDQEKRLIRMTVDGFTNPDQAAAFDAQLRTAVQKLKASGPSFDILADLRHGMILPQARSELIRNEMLWMAQQGLRKAAHIMASTLYKLQLKRVAPDNRFNYFTTEKEALDWLNE